jgi:hypothetical protein
MHRLECNAMPEHKMTLRAILIKQRTEEKRRLQRIAVMTNTSKKEIS